MDTRRVFASKTTESVIDLLNAATGRTVCFGHNLEECRKDYPDAEEMSLEDFCQWKATQQRTPITWEATTEERFNEMLNCLPPAIMRHGGFLVGEPFDHDAISGKPRFQAFRQAGGVYQVSTRVMTIEEFKKEVAA